ncbi:ParA family protein [Agaribacterium sp. ZY112]|uniref:ParA family protein n=1 Tax=Agaribacterium sp. ZY112 TaxID=3233574 RepID=UPI00352440E1
MQVWTIANQKGGVAKTTTSVSFAGIAAEEGLRVLLIDLDPHGSLTSWFSLVETGKSSSIFDLFDKRNELTLALLEEVIQPSAFENIDVIPSALVLATLERRAVGEGMGLVIKRALALVEHEYDLVLIDCPPQLGVLMVNALAACDQLVIPVQTEYLAIQGLERMLNTLTMMQRSRGAPFNYCIVPVMYDKRTQASVQSLRQIRMDHEPSTWPGKIPIDTRLRDASKAGLPINVFDKSARSALAYHSLFTFLHRAANEARPEAVQ